VDSGKTTIFAGVGILNKTGAGAGVEFSVFGGGG